MGESDSLKKSHTSKEIITILEVGQNLVAQKKLTEAITHYQNALEKFPRNVKILENIGDVFKILGKYEDAIKFYDKALELDPKNLVLLMNGKGRALFDLGRVEELVECCKIGLQIDPKNVQILNTMGGALVGEKNEEAMLYINKALEIEPNNIMALLGKGSCYIDMKRYDDAKKLFERVLELSPNHPMGIFLSADAHIKQHPELSETPEFKELREWRDNFSKRIPEVKHPK